MGISSHFYFGLITFLANSEEFQAYPIVCIRGLFHYSHILLLMLGTSFVIALNWSCTEIYSTKCLDRLNECPLNQGSANDVGLTYRITLHYMISNKVNQVSLIESELHSIGTKFLTKYCVISCGQNVFLCQEAHLPRCSPIQAIPLSTPFFDLFLAGSFAVLHWDYMRSGIFCDPPRKPFPFHDHFRLGIEVRLLFGEFGTFF